MAITLSHEHKFRIRLGIAVIIIGMLALGARLFYLQIIKGDYYYKLTSVTHIYKERVQAKRGLIFDRYGELLATNIPIYNLYMMPKFVKDIQKEIEILTNLGILDMDEAVKTMEKYRKIKGLKRYNLYLIKKNLVSRYCPKDNARLIPEKNGLLRCPVCGHVFKDMVARFNLYSSKLPGFYIKTRMRRYYPKKGLTVHPVGYVNEVNRRDIKKHPELYRRGDLIGRSGVEKAFDRLLRGKNGIRVFIQTAGGHRIDPSTLPPPFNKYRDTPSVAGDNITLTIDWDLTRAAQKAMRWRRSGAVVVLDANTGEVLVMYSKPTFNPNLGNFGWKSTPKYNPGWYSPMLNKTLMAYPPGSTFKMVTSIAALNEVVIDPFTKLHCGGAYYFRGHRFGCHARYGHGEVDMFKALEVSCDVYYYQVAQMLGMDTMAHYARDFFGLGEHTGVQIPEHIGLIPTIRWHQRHSPGGYVPGFDLNMAVGQGAVKVTPLQLARAYAALVNGGRLLKVSLIKKITTPDGKVIYQHKPEVERYLGFSPDIVKVVKAGLYLVVHGRHGTARHVAVKGIDFSGKTGTAQAPEYRPNAPKAILNWLKQDHAWFASFAPSDNTKIVVVVFIEHGGGGGKVAAPVARDVIKAYYHLYQNSLE